MGGLQHLKVLDLSGNHFGENTVNITNPLIRKSSEVKYFRQDSSIPHAWGDGFPSLVDLDLSYNVLHGTIPPCLANLSKLESLWLASNRFRGTVPVEFANLPVLKNLSVELNLPICSDTVGAQPPE